MAEPSRDLVWRRTKEIDEVRQLHVIGESKRQVIAIRRLLQRRDGTSLRLDISRQTSMRLTVNYAKYTDRESNARHAMQFPISGSR